MTHTMTLPDEIKVIGTERHGDLHFSQDLEFFAGDYIIGLTIDGYQAMIYSDEGWEINPDAKIETNYIIDFKVWKGEEETNLNTDKLLLEVIDLIRIEL